MYEWKNLLATEIVSVYLCRGNEDEDKNKFSRTMFLKSVLQLQGKKPFLKNSTQIIKKNEKILQVQLHHSTKSVISGRCQNSEIFELLEIRTRSGKIVYILYCITDIDPIHIGINLDQMNSRKENIITGQAFFLL